MRDNKKDFALFLQKLMDLNKEYTTTKPELTKRLMALTKEFRTAMVNSGSATPDNLAAANLLAVKINRSPGSTHREISLCLRKHNISVADVLYMAEESEIPRPVLEEYPKLSQEEWTASCRLVILMLGVFASFIED